MSNIHFGDVIQPSSFDSSTTISLTMKSNNKSKNSNNLHAGCIGVFTSGGDSQGMNAAVRGVVRMALYLGCPVYFIKEGYQGMVDGSPESIVQANWESVSGIIHQGGTVIGSARCKEFMLRSGRLKAAKNLVDHNICNLVVIGGDGSLTGADLFKREWSSLLEELVSTGEITDQARLQNSRLNIVGMVGSIDNDFCGTDMTIGTDTALHRILEAIDSIVTTASSHQRAFILEVMGRHCGYLALVAGIACEADAVFIPEDPPETDKWQQKLTEKIQLERSAGKRLNIVLVAEGAMDRAGNPITSEDVRKVIKEQCGQDVRITVLGHVQRGGNPSAFDRILGSVMGAAATRCLLEDDISLTNHSNGHDNQKESEACVITLVGNEVLRLPLMDCVEQTKSVARAMAEGQWDRVVELRGLSFRRNLETYNLLTNDVPPSILLKPTNTFRIGILHAGAPCGGMNAAVRSAVRNLLYSNRATVLGIHDGIDGLIKGAIHPVTWSEVSGWVGQGGAHLGTRRTVPTEENIAKIAEKLKEFRIQALLVIGGFEAFVTVLRMAEYRTRIPELCIPICLLPATISNNVPGTDFSLGTDTALNSITTICDRIRQSAQGTRSVFIVETMGGYCGYLATLSGLACGADASLIYEDPFNISTLYSDIKLIENKMNEAGVTRGLILRNEQANPHYTTDFIYHLYAEEGKNIFSVRQNILGHAQQGGYPSPFDRKFEAPADVANVANMRSKITGTKLATKASAWLLAQLDVHSHPLPPVIEESCILTYSCTLPDTAVVLGLVGRTYEFTPVQTLKAETDFEHRIPRHHWFMKLRPLLRILAHHNSDFSAESETQRKLVKHSTLLADY